MRSLEELLKKNNLKDPENIEGLLELAEITELLISEKRYADLELLICYTIRNDCYEAFTWVMAAIQQEFDRKESCRLTDFNCFLGKSIADYDELISHLQVDLKAIDSDVRTVIGNDGEVQSFFNILIYRTAYVYLYRADKGCQSRCGADKKLSSTSGADPPIHVRT